jgi:Rne/Rng family ribonuclease
MSNKSSVVYLSSSYLDVAFLINQDKVVKIFYDAKDNLPKLNSIYLGKIIDKSDANGCFFINLDDKHKAILKFHKNNSHYKVGENILVQIIRESFQIDEVEKNSICSDDIALLGKFVIYKPLGNNFIINKNLDNDKKIALKNLHILQDFTGLLRGSYKHNNQDLLIKEVEYLKNLYAKIKQDTFGLVYKEDLIYRACFDNSHYLVDSIIIDGVIDVNKKDGDLWQIKQNHDYIKIEHYLNKEFIFEYFNINEAIELAFANKYAITDAIQLVFFENESFNYIDVNFKSDNFFNSKEENSYKVNNQILPIIAQIIELKNLSGQILVDLLKINNKNYNKNLISSANIHLAKDTLKANALGFSNLGLLEIMRQKVKPTLNLDNDFKLKMAILTMMSHIQNLYINNLDKKIMIKVSQHFFDKLTNIAKLEYEKIMTDYNIQLIVDVNVKENYIVQFSK